MNTVIEKEPFHWLGADTVLAIVLKDRVVMTGLHERIHGLQLLINALESGNRAVALCKQTSINVPAMLDLLGLPDVNTDNDRA